MSSAPNPTFDAVLAAAKAGDSIAFEQLYRMLNRRVASFAAARRAADPEGLVNDVFIRVFKNLPTFEGNEDQFIGWVFQITRNRLIDESRHRQRRVDELLLAEQPTRRAHTAVEEEALSQIEGERLLGQLDCLTDDQRDVVLLRVVADQSLEVVAASLDKSVGAIKSIQRRALRTLAREFGEILPEAVSR
jgi:RNA polymerase sigma factor (sigma-70 family)